jgi:hypothetical protein
MATFSQWLSKQEDGPQDDPVAWLARQWKALEGNRPRVSSPSGIEKHLMTLAAGEPAQQDQWTGYVHQAVADATGRYKDDKTRESEAKASSGEQQDQLPGTGLDTTGVDRAHPLNPATGKPVAVVPSSHWAEHPDASKYGSCYICGWARGLAKRDVDDPAGGVVMTCAAGHIFEPAKPGPADAGPAATTSPVATAAPAAGELTPEQVNEAESFRDDMPGMEYVTDEGPVDLLALVNLKLTVLCISLGLPTDPGAMMELITAAAEQQQDESDTLAGQLAEAGMRAAAGEPRAVPAEAGSQVSGQPLLPWDLAQLYAQADPEATGG